MKVLLLLHELSLTGAPKLALDAAEELVRTHGVALRTISLTVGPLEERFRRLGPVLILRDQLTWGSVGDSLRRQAILLRWNITAWRFLRGWRPDLLYVNSIASLPFGQFLKLPKAPALLHVHEFGTTAAPGIQYPWQRALFLRWPARYIAVSDAVRRMLVQEGVPADRIGTVHAFVADRIVSSSLEAARERDQPLIIGGAGTPGWQKGPVLWLQMAVELRRLLGPERVRFVWVGMTSSLANQQFREMARKLGLESVVEFVPVTAQPLRRFERFDVFALTSWEDSCPLVVLENMALGKPVVCFANSGGATEEIGDAGIAVDGFSPAAMAREIAALAQSPQQRAALGQRAQARIRERFVASIQAPKLVEQMRQALRASTPSPTSTVQRSACLQVCFVTQKFPPSPKSGSIGSVFQQLAAGLVSQGHAAHVVTRAEPGQAGSTVDEQGVIVHRLGHETPWRIWQRLEQWVPALFWLRYSRQVDRKLRELIRSRQINVVVSAEYGAETLWFALGRKPAPLVVSLHGPSVIANRLNGRHGLNARLQEWCERALVRRADALHAVSRRLAASAARALGVPARHLRVIHNPVDAVRFTPPPRVGGRGSARRVLYVGRLEPLKGVEVLARAIPLVHQSMPEAEFVFVGRDLPSGEIGRSMRQRLLDLLDGSHDRVTFLNQLPHERVIAQYHASACCVFPSLADSLPTVTLEAMACGKPVIGTTDTGHAEIIEHGVNGLLVTPGDTQALAAAILMLLRNDGLRYVFGQQGRDTVQARFSGRRITAQWAEWLTAVRDTSRKGPR